MLRDRVLQGERGRVHERAIEPYKLMNGQEGWYVHAWDLEKDATRSFRLDRIRGRPCSTRPSSRARASSPTSTAGLAPARSPRPHRARLDLARAGPLGARGQARRAGARRRRRRRRAALRRAPLAGARDPQGGRRRRGARAREAPPGGARSGRGAGRRRQAVAPKPARGSRRRRAGWVGRSLLPVTYFTPPRAAP